RKGFTDRTQFKKGGRSDRAFGLSGGNTIIEQIGVILRNYTNCHAGNIVLFHHRYNRRVYSLFDSTQVLCGAGGSRDREAGYQGQDSPQCGQRSVHERKNKRRWKQRQLVLSLVSLWPISLDW